MDSILGASYVSVLLSLFYTDVLTYIRSGQLIVLDMNSL